MPLTVHVPFHIREETTVMTILCVNKPEHKRGRGGGGGREGEEGEEGGEGEEGWREGEKEGHVVHVIVTSSSCTACLESTGPSLRVLVKQIQQVTTTLLRAGDLNHMIS